MRVETAKISEILGKVHTGYWIMTAVSIVMFIGIIGFIIYCLVKYRRSVHKTPAQIEGSILLETIWTVVPTIVVMGFFLQGWDTFAAIRAIPENAIEVTVHGRMWSWSYEYANGYQTDVLILPKDRPVKLNMSSDDVIHSFYIPAFRLKEDVVPGLATYLAFTPDIEGEFNVFCAEFCGRLHSLMLSKVKIVPEADYDSFVEATTAELTAATPDDPAGRRKQAESIMRRNGCVTCHSVDGKPLVGPTFKGLYESKRKVRRDGAVISVTADAAYIERSIRDPKLELLEGYDPLMPEIDLSDDEVRVLVEYLENLGE